MKSLNYLLLAMLSSFVLYFFVFHFIHKPLTIDFIKDTIEKKKAYGAKITSPKLLIIAGSNGRFSHRCETIEQILQIPCVNGSIAAGIDINFIIEHYKTILQSGDIVYMPWEYSQYKEGNKNYSDGPDNDLLVHFYRYLLSRRSFAEVIRAYLYFDISYLIQGAVEMGLARRGFERRFNLNTMTDQGDERGHTVEKGKEYEQHIRKLDWIGPEIDVIGENSRSTKVLREFMQWASEHHILIIGGLPTTFNDRPISPEVIDKVAKIYLDAGHCFLVLPNHSQYPRNCFYDTSFHLNESCQIQHSITLAKFLAERWPLNQGCAMLTNTKYH